MPRRPSPRLKLAKASSCARALNDIGNAGRARLTLACKEASRPGSPGLRPSGVDISAFSCSASGGKDSVGRLSAAVALSRACASRLHRQITPVLAPARDQNTVASGSCSGTSKSGGAPGRFRVGRIGIEHAHQHGGEIVVIGRCAPGIRGSMRPSAAAAVGAVATASSMSASSTYSQKPSLHSRNTSPACTAGVPSLTLSAISSLPRAAVRMLRLG